MHIYNLISNKAMMKEINKRTSDGKTWKIINGNHVWLDKEASV